MSEVKKPELLKEVGTFDVQILEPYWEAPREDAPDKEQMCLVLPCHTFDGRVAYFRLYFSNKLAAKGRNAGRALHEISAEQCIELGMAAPFDPSRIDELNDKTADLVMEEDTYQGKTTVRPKWLNPQRAKKLDKADAGALWAKMTGKTAAKMTGKTAAKKAEPDDDLPFG